MQLANGAWVGKLVEAAVAREDDEQERLRTAAVALFVAIAAAVSPAWIATYLMLGRPLSAAIVGLFLLVSLGSFVWLAWRRHFRAFGPTQIAMAATLPVLLQASLGGFEHGSAVAIWSFSAPMAALIAYGVRAGARWFGVFVGSVVALGLADGALRAAIAPPPVSVEAAFFVLDVAAPAAAVMVLLAYFIRGRDQANARTETLLLQILPATIVTRLKRGESQIADSHEAATVLFADIVEFTSFASATAPGTLVALLGRAFSELDALAIRHGLEKIKTLGDGYLAVAGVTHARSDHAQSATRMALELQPTLVTGLGADWPGLQFRVGLASGALVAGVLGRDRRGFDVWGDIVNTASRMASGAPAGGVQVTEETGALINNEFRLERREQVAVKGKGRMTTYLVLGPRLQESPLTASR